MQDPNEYTHLGLTARIATNFRRLTENVNELARRLAEINDDSADLRQLTEHWQQYLENTQLVLQKLYER